MTVPFRFAICNEVFEKASLAAACKHARELGYEGIELAPFTFGEDPAALTETDCTQMRKVIEKEGLEFVGLHWLLVGPSGLHATTRDETVRKRTWGYIHRMIDICADIAGSKAQDNGLLVFGSPKQRSSTNGMTPREACDVFTHELAHAAPHAESRGVKILVEALPLDQSDVVNTLADAVAIVRQIGSPAIQTMFDTHNAVEEVESHAVLVDRYFDAIRHVHVNEMDGSHPSRGDYDFRPVLTILKQRGYQGWVSLEAFDFSMPPEVIVTETIDYLKQISERLPE